MRPAKRRRFAKEKPCRRLGGGPQGKKATLILQRDWPDGVQFIAAENLLIKSKSKEQLHKGTASESDRKFATTGKQGMSRNLAES